MNEQEAIEILKDEHDWCQEPCYVIKAIEVAISALRAQQYRQNGGWISVKDRLPEKQTRVLVRTAETYTGTTVGWIMWGKWVTDVGEQSKTVTHWTPLPEPPKEDAINE